MTFATAHRSGLEPSYGPAAPARPIRRGAAVSRARAVRRIRIRSIGLMRGSPVCVVLLNGVAAAGHAGTQRALIVLLLRADLLRVRLLLGLPLTDLLVLPHGAEHRAGGGADRRALARVAADGAADGADRGPPCRPASSTRGWRRRGRRSVRGRGGRVEPRLLHCPHVAVRPVLLLLLLALSLLRVVVGLRRSGRGNEAGGENDHKRNTQDTMS